MPVMRAQLEHFLLGPERSRDVLYHGEQARRTFSRGEHFVPLMHDARFALRHADLVVHAEALAGFCTRERDRSCELATIRRRDELDKLREPGRGRAENALR